MQIVIFEVNKVKKDLIFTAVLSALVFSACSGEIDSNEFMNNDEEYRACMALIGDNDLDENGFYNNFDDVTDSTDESSVPDGKILVSLGSNNTMDLQYYRDAECSDLIKDTICYVNPGDIIYAKYPLFKTAGTDRKLFDTFKVYYYNDKGERNHDTTLECVNKTGASVLKVLQIPESYDYTNLSVVPVSTYEDRELHLDDYYKDENGEKISLSQKWEVNTGADSPLTTENDSISFNPFNNYIVSLDFDEDKYYFSSSSPKAWHYDNATGYVEFHQQSADDAISEFKVELAPYTPITLNLSDLGINADFTLSNSATNKLEVNTDINKVRGIKGDHLSCKISTDPEKNNLYQLIKNNDLEIKNLKLLSDDKMGTWEFEIVDENEGVSFNPSIFSFEHGEINFYQKNNCINAPTKLYEGDIIQYIATPDIEYYYKGEQKDEYEYIFHPLYSEYEIQNDFKFVKKQTKILEYPKEGGTIIYKLNGEIVPENEKEIYYLEGKDHLTIEIKPDVNYKLSTDKAYSGMEIKFDNNSQLIRIDGKDINHLFIPTDESSNAIIQMNIDPTVGEELKFDINSYSPEKIFSHIVVWGINPPSKPNFTEYFQKKEKSPCISFIEGSIGDTNYYGKFFPATGFSINVSNGNITKDKAIRFTIDSTDSNGKEYHYVRYVNSVPGSVEVPVDTSKIYKKFTITIAKVSVEIHNSDRYNVPNTDVAINFTDDDDKLLLNNGDVIESTRDVEMVITPKTGYELIVDGNIVAEYKISCKYSKLHENFSKELIKIDTREKGVQ